MKADGIEYEERMELLEQVTYPRPLAEPLEQALRLYREAHPWVLETDLSPKSVVRDMYEWGRTFTELGQLETAATALSDPPGRVVMNAAAWETALGAYWDEYETMDAGPPARAPELLIVERSAVGSDARTWTVRQIIDDPEAHHDWAIVATVDLDASDAAGEPVIRTQSCRSAG